MSIKLGVHRSLKTTDLRLPLPQHRLWRESLHLLHSTAAAILGSFRVACCVIDTVSDLSRIHPYKLLRVVEPFHFKFFLTDRAKTVRWVVGDGNVL